MGKDKYRSLRVDSLALQLTIHPEENTLIVEIPGAESPEQVGNAKRSALIHLNSTITQLRQALNSSKEALEKDQENDNHELADIGALFLETQKIGKELVQLENSISISFGKELKAVVYSLCPGSVVFLKELNKTAVWCCTEGLPKDSIFMSTVPVKKSGEAFIL